MAPVLLRCDKCQTALPGAVVNTGTLVACPACGVATLVQVFPAFARPAPRGRPAEPLASPEDAGCFYHQRKKAAVPCDECGRFLCALCDLELDGRHVCPECVEIARKGGRGLRPVPRTLHDQVALAVAIVGTVIFSSCLFSVPTTLVAGVFTAPVTLFLVWRYRREPARSPVPRGRWRLVVAGVLGALQTLTWLVFLFAYLTDAPWLK